MTRGIWLAAIAAALAVGPAIAGDDAIPLGRYKPTTGGFSGGVPQSPTLNTAQPAPTDEDTELVHWRRGFYGGYGWRGGWGGGWGGNAWAWNAGWRGNAWGWNRGWGAPAWGWNGGWGAPAWGWNGGWGRPAWGYGYASFYRPGFAVSFYSAPQVFYPTYYGFFPVSGGNAPTVNLNQTWNQPREVLPPNPRTDTFQYDGGPSRPIPAPQPVPDRGNPAPPRIEPATDGTLSIKYARPATTTKSAYKFPAYGDK